MPRRGRLDRSLLLSRHPFRSARLSGIVFDCVAPPFRRVEFVCFAPLGEAAWNHEEVENAQVRPHPYDPCPFVRSRVQ